MGDVIQFEGGQLPTIYGSRYDEIDAGRVIGRNTGGLVANRTLESSIHGESLSSLDGGIGAVAGVASGETVIGGPIACSLRTMPVDAAGIPCVFTKGMLMFVLHPGKNTAQESMPLLEKKFSGVTKTLDAFKHTKKAFSHGDPIVHILNKYGNWHIPTSQAKQESILLSIAQVIKALHDLAIFAKNDPDEANKLTPDLLLRKESEKVDEAVESSGPSGCIGGEDSSRTSSKPTKSFHQITSDDDMEDDDAAFSVSDTRMADESSSKPKHKHQRVSASGKIRAMVGSTQDSGVPAISEVHQATDKSTSHGGESASTSDRPHPIIDYFISRLEFAGVYQHNNVSTVSVTVSGRSEIHNYFRSAKPYYGTKRDHSGATIGGKKSIPRTGINPEAGDSVGFAFVRAKFNNITGKRKDVSAIPKPGSEPNAYWTYVPTPVVRYHCAGDYVFVDQNRETSIVSDDTIVITIGVITVISTRAFNAEYSSGMAERISADPQILLPTVFGESSEIRDSCEPQQYAVAHVHAAANSTDIYLFVDSKKFVVCGGNKGSVEKIISDAVEKLTTVGKAKDEIIAKFKGFVEGEEENNKMKLEDTVSEKLNSIKRSHPRKGIIVENIRRLTGGAFDILNKLYSAASLKGENKTQIKYAWFAISHAKCLYDTLGVRKD